MSFAPSTKSRTTNNSQSTSTSARRIITGPRNPDPSVERGREQVAARPQPEEPIPESPNRRPQSLPRSSGSSPISSAPYDPLGRNLASVSNSQANQNPTSTIVNPVITMSFDKSKLPANYGKNCPKFDGEDPENLEPYLAIIDELIETSKAGSDGDKKYIALRYCVPATQREWKALVTASAEHSWEEFKLEVIENYPEVREAKEGSLKLLEKIVKTHRKARVGPEDSGDFMSFSRKFRAEAEKLLFPTQRISNRELVKYMLACLDESLIEAVRVRMRTIATADLPSTKTLAELKKIFTKNAAAKDAEARIKAYEGWKANREDRYFWSDMLDIAKEVVEEEAVSFYDTEVKRDPTKRSMKTAPSATILYHDHEEEANTTKILKFIEDKMQKVELAMANGLDKVTIDSHKRWIEMEAALKDMQVGKVSMPTAPTQRWGPPGGGFGNRPPASDKCYYCNEPGHFMGDCAHRRNDIASGLIKVTDGRTTFCDGRPIPRQPANKSQMVKAQEYQGRASVNLNLQHYSEIDVVDPGQHYDPTMDELRTLKAEKAFWLAQQQSGSEASNQQGSATVFNQGVQPPSNEELMREILSMRAFMQEQGLLELSETEQQLAQTRKNLENGGQGF